MNKGLFCFDRDKRRAKTCQKFRLLGKSKTRRYRNRHRFIVIYINFPEMEKNFNFKSLHLDILISLNNDAQSCLWLLLLYFVTYGKCKYLPMQYRNFQGYFVIVELAMNYKDQKNSKTELLLLPLSLLPPLLLLLLCYFFCFFPVEFGLNFGPVGELSLNWEHIS